LPAAVAASEAHAVVALVEQWIDVERARPPFEVLATEARATVELAGRTVDVRLDRVDALPDGGVAVVDYKTGRATKPARWFDERPQGLQLGLYAKARAQQAPGEPVRALVYAQLRAGEVRAVGLADDANTWPGLALPADVKTAVALVDWADATTRLGASVEALAAGFAAGDARVAPRNFKNVCRLCGLRALCRAGAVIDAGPANDAEGDDD
jgi:ATP-dependent helicase/DNAse subunit B